MTRRGLVVVVTSALAAISVLAGAVAAVGAMRASHAQAVQVARTEALASAAAGVPVALSYNYRHLDRDFAAAEARLTPRFRRQYAAVTAKQVEALATKYHVTSTAEITASAVVSAEADRVVLLVFVNQTSTNSLRSAPRLDRSRIDVTMARTGGRWLIDRLDPL